MPSKVSFYAWEAWWGKVLTMQQLKKRGFQFASRCPFCRKEEEDLEHILNHCPSIWGLWTDILLVAGVSWTTPFLVKDLICSWGQFPVQQNTRRLWQAVPLSISWAIGKERNRIVFEDLPFSYSILTTHSIISSLLFWAGIVPNVETSIVRRPSSVYMTSY